MLTWRVINAAQSSLHCCSHQCSAECFLSCEALTAAVTSDKWSRQMSGRMCRYVPCDYDIIVSVSCGRHGCVALNSDWVDGWIIPHLIAHQTIWGCQIWVCSHCHDLFTFRLEIIKMWIAWMQITQSLGIGITLNKSNIKKLCKYILEILKVKLFVRVFFWSKLLSIHYKPLYSSAYLRIFCCKHVEHKKCMNYKYRWF